MGDPTNEELAERLEAIAAVIGKEASLETTPADRVEELADDEWNIRLAAARLRQPLPSGDGWTKIEAELTASREREKKLADELKRSLDAWSNILDLGLVPENYRPDVRVVIERIDRALAAHREAGE